MYYKKWLQYLQMSWIAINENRGRSILTMLGIIIGVGAVVLMTSLGRGAESLILGSVSSFGNDLIYISPGSPDEGLGAGSITSVDRIKYRDYLDLKKVDFLQNVTPFLVYDAILVLADQNEKAQVVGTTNGYSKALNFYPEEGRFIEDFDNSSAARVVVLGYKLSDRLFGDQDPIDQDIKIKGLNFRVVGVMEEQGGNAFESYDDMAFMPITTLQTYLFGVDYVQTIMAQAIGSMDEAIIQTREAIRRIHNIDNPTDDLSKDDFSIISQEQAVGIFTSVSSVLTLFISLIASISLLVGGIGIMNIMYVSVNQRTREIGLRKAVGATSRDILFQFLLEAVVLTLIGGFLGVLGGLGLAFLAARIIVKFQSTWQFLVNEQALLIALIVSILIGVIFGLYPARKAAAKNPIEALRYE
ncbi:ABC transporter permease [Candidatus Peregrinibacteria bacterium]|nr:ABC transporter permease [Candidatus Peregrinibacteria bacterium]